MDGWPNWQYDKLALWCTLLGQKKSLATPSLLPWITCPKIHFIITQGRRKKRDLLEGWRYWFTSWLHFHSRCSLFQVKTHSTNAVLFYNTGPSANKDFVALEIWNGLPRLLLDQVRMKLKRCFFQPDFINRPHPIENDLESVWASSWQLNNCQKNKW